MLIVFVSWCFFDSIGSEASFAVIGRMFGIGVSEFAGSEALYYLRSYAAPFIIGIIGTTPLIKTLAEMIDVRKLSTTVLEPVVLAMILIASTASMIDGSFNPFIYFRF